MFPNEYYVCEIISTIYFISSLLSFKYKGKHNIRLETYSEYQPCPVSEDVSKRILCLPLYLKLSKEEMKYIVEIISQTLSK